MQRGLVYLAFALGLPTIALELAVRAGVAPGLVEIARYAPGIVVLLSLFAMIPYAKAAAAQREAARERELDRRTRDSLADALTRIARNQ